MGNVAIAGDKPVLQNTESPLSLLFDDLCFISGLLLPHCLLLFAAFLLFLLSFAIVYLQCCCFCW